jgi:hypothetical protein
MSNTFFTTAILPVFKQPRSFERGFGFGVQPLPLAQG